MKTRTIAASLLLGGLGLTALPASAGFLLGEITIAGAFAPTGGTSLADATGIDFLGDHFWVTAAGDDFAAHGIGPGDAGMINDFGFGAGAAAFDLWTISGFTFHSDPAVTVMQNSNFLILRGSGTLSGNGYLETAGIWSLTANRAGSIFNFSAGTTVPEPMTLALFGIGLLGFGASRLRKAN